MGIVQVEFVQLDCAAKDCAEGKCAGGIVLGAGKASAATTTNTNDRKMEALFTFDTRAYSVCMLYAAKLLRKEKLWRRCGV
jgi:hypothetical protein